MLKSASMLLFYSTIQRPAAKEKQLLIKNPSYGFVESVLGGSRPRLYSWCFVPTQGGGEASIEHKLLLRIPAKRQMRLSGTSRSYTAATPVGGPSPPASSLTGGRGAPAVYRARSRVSWLCHRKAVSRFRRDTPAGEPRNQASRYGLFILAQFS